MTKYPKTVWVVFKKGEPKTPLDSASYKFRFYDKKVHCQKRYHLHPGNEVARALNVLNKQPNISVIHENLVALELRKAGFPVRWDAKKGKFA